MWDGHRLVITIGVGSCLRLAGGLAAPGHEVQEGHHQCAWIGEMLAHRVIKLVEFPLAGDALLHDHPLHTAHQIEPDRAA